MGLTFGQVPRGCRVLRVCWGKVASGPFLERGVLSAMWPPFLYKVMVTGGRGEGYLFIHHTFLRPFRRI